MKRSRTSNGSATVTKKQKTNPQPGRSHRTVNNGQPSATSFAAVAYASGQHVSGPKIVRSNAQGTRVRHRELVATVSGSVGFAVSGSYVLNPGLAATFPWLSVQAKQWEQYRFHRLRFEYVTRSGTAVGGSVLFAPDYDSMDAAPASEAIATSYRDAVEDAPWKDQLCPLDPSAMHPMGPRKYIRDSNIANGDLKTYDGGAIHICTVGQADTAAIGKLWVDYDVEFFVPQISSGASEVSRVADQHNLLVNQTVTTAVETLIAFPTKSSSTGITMASDGLFTMPKGCWILHIDCASSGATSADASLILQLKKNGVATVPATLTFTRPSGSPASPSEVLQAHMTAFLTSNGSDVFSLHATVTSVTGTLVLLYERTRFVPLAV